MTATLAIPPLQPNPYDADPELLLAAARLRVQATLTGEPERAGGGSWRDLLARVATADRSGPPVRLDGDRLVLDDADGDADGDAAQRLLNYHRVALLAMIVDPEAEHDHVSLLSADERELQLHGMAGPSVELPDARVHELFEQRVRRQPDAVAAECGDRRLTYAQLNAQANRLAHGLLARGLDPEDVVAVVTERTTDWMAAVLAILKAGGAYLPIEPHFPAGRIAASLRRADCRYALTEPGSSTGLDEALADGTVRAERVELASLAAGRPEHDPGVSVRPDQLAYLYFTSGSTGEPKGAMCEQAGMLNHLLAKIEDLEITEGDVVAQTAPQCFDISLWQLLAALLVGGRTVIVPQPAILDLPTMIETITGGRVGVLQLVPSYLEVVLSYLDQHPRELPDLHVVSVTGEAVKPDLVRRFFAAPALTGVALVNAYGLTETSDDTNHEVMHEAPADDRVPLGRPIRNVTVYVTDPDLQPVPLGAPGEIVFSGVAVGRGYVNDPERTAAAFGSDPHRPGHRLYRSGDFGRWRPDGKLEFLGRRDAQLKISGFRIEIGEIENTLLRAPGVRDAAVVVITGTDGNRHLVGFYAADTPLAPTAIHDHLAATLPPYMVPAAVHHEVALPLSDNGKTDKKALTALATELAAHGSQGDERPATPSELAVAAAWATALGVPADELRRDDHFVDRGGSSLAAVKVVIALQRRLTLKQVVDHPVLADLAVVLDGARSPALASS